MCLLIAVCQHQQLHCLEMITDCISDFVQDQPARTNGSGKKVEGRERVEGRESEEGEREREGVLLLEACWLQSDGVYW